MKLKTIALCAILILLRCVVYTSAATLSEGDPAPKLTVSKWIQGEPIKTFEPGTAYLIHFWATWWFPCKEAMAHVNRLHQTYKNKGLVVIGQNVKETPGTDLEQFIQRMGTVMSFRVALDQDATNQFSGKMLESWLSAAEAGIPAAFIIDKNGTINFIGHPEEIDDALIQQVLDGTFDLNKRFLARKDAAAKAEVWEKHNESGRLAWKAKQWDKAMSEIDQLEKHFPNKRAVTHCLRITVLIRKDDFETASKLALQLSTDNPADPFLQHRLARTIATQARSKYLLEGFERDMVHSAATNSIILKTAELLMERASSEIKGPEPEFLVTQARLAFLQGNRERAIQLVTKAFAVAEPGIKEFLADALESFKSGRLPQ